MLWQVLAVLLSDDGMEEEEAGKGGPGIAGSQSSPAAFSVEQLSAPVLLGETDPCGVVSESSIQAGFENSLEDADFAVAGADNDFNGAQVVVLGSSGAGAGFSCSLQDDFAVVVLLVAVAR